MYIVDILILNKHCHAFFQLGKLWEIICCKTQSEHAFSYRGVWLVMHCLFVFIFSFDTRCQSVNGPTQLPIEKLREIIYSKTPSEHAFSDMCVVIGNALLTSFLFYTLSVCEPTPGDYKFAKPNRTHFH